MPVRKITLDKTHMTHVQIHVAPQPLGTFTFPFSKSRPFCATIMEGGAADSPILVRNDISDDFGL